MNIFGQKQVTATQKCVKPPYCHSQSWSSLLIPTPRSKVKWVQGS